jgi:hypothetical protein
VPQAFRHADVVYVLAFACILLNTDLFNPAVKRKITFEAFVSMNRGIDGGADIPVDVLRGLYDSIKRDGISLELECNVVTFHGCRREGWLTKQGDGGLRRWQRRYVVLNDHCLYYFKRKAVRGPRRTNGRCLVVSLAAWLLTCLCAAALQDVEAAKPLCVMPLENLVATSEGDDTLCLRSTVKDGVVKTAKRSKSSSGGMVQGKHVEFRLRAESSTDRDEWLRDVNQEITRSPFVRVFERKRSQLRQGKLGYGAYLRSLHRASCIVCLSSCLCLCRRLCPCLRVCQCVYWSCSAGDCSVIAPSCETHRHTSVCDAEAASRRRGHAARAARCLRAGSRRTPHSRATALMPRGVYPRRVT